MSPLDVPISSLPADQLKEHIRALKTYIDETTQPNITGHDGQTCLRLALAFCNDPDGDQRIASLLNRGADPNFPNAFVNFQTFTNVAKHVEPLNLLINAGMRLSDVYTIDAADMPTQREGRSPCWTMPRTSNVT